jgi:serine/threonine protein kinase
VSHGLPDDDTYELRGEHARGGRGRVLRAFDRRFGRMVAIKELLGGVGDNPRRFLREVQLAARLQHPGVVPIYDVGRWSDGAPYYVMKLVEGRTLKALIEDAKTLEDRLALLPKALSVIETMSYVHSQGIIHRDLKPSNVMVGRFGETVIVDWGLAKEIGVQEELPSATMLSAPDDETVDGAVLGTPAYMPPEQARGEQADERADVYALGSLLYHLVAGVPPYRGDTPNDVLCQLLAGPPAGLWLREPSAPRDLIRVIDRAMSRKTASRYASTTELAVALRACLEPKRRRRRAAA